MLALVILLFNACTPMPYETQQILNRVAPELRNHNTTAGDPVFIRIFKESHTLELWMKARGDRHYSLVKTYPICQWSGHLGPKLREGDHQAPEGFYATNLDNLHPESIYHLSFNLQFPNAFDRMNGRTGSFLMVHGDCVSRGCYAMTDPVMEEIYVLVEQALLAGQAEVPVHIFPFRMTEERMAQAQSSPHYAFWRNLQEGYDLFETHKIPPQWMAIRWRYEFY